MTNKKAKVEVIYRAEFVPCEFLLEDNCTDSAFAIAVEGYINSMLKKGELANIAPQEINVTVRAYNPWEV